MSTIDHAGMIINFLLVIFVFVCWILLVIKFIKNRCASVMVVKAVVVDKYKTKPISRTQGAFTNEKYMIVFLTDNKKLAFEVSEFSFQGYKINEKGTLKYKGNKLIDFIIYD